MILLPIYSIDLVLSDRGSCKKKKNRLFSGRHDKIYVVMAVGTPFKNYHNIHGHFDIIFTLYTPCKNRVCRVRELFALVFY